MIIEFGPEAFSLLVEILSMIVNIALGSSTYFIFLDVKNFILYQDASNVRSNKMYDVSMAIICLYYALTTITALFLLVTGRFAPVLTISMAVCLSLMFLSEKILRWVYERTGSEIVLMVACMTLWFLYIIVFCTGKEDLKEIVLKLVLG